MNDSFHIGEILKDGFSTIESPSRRLWYLVFLPVILAIILVLLLGVQFSVNSHSTIISALAIFTGFFFTLIVYVSDKAQGKKRELGKSTNPKDKEFLNTYISFTESLIIQISYSIVFALILIFLFFLTQYDLWYFKNYLNFDLMIGIKKAIDIVVLSFTLHFIIFLLLIVSNMYSMFLEETSQ